MIENLNKYKELLTTLEEERKYLHILESVAKESQEEFINIENNIKTLIKEKEDLENNITGIISTKQNKLYKYLSVPTSIITLTITYLTTTLSNFDIGIIFAGIISSLLCCTCINHIITNIVTKIYKKKNPTIKKLQTKIHEHNLLLHKYKKNKTLVFNNKVNNRINYNNQIHKVKLLEETINQIKLDYATTIFNKELEGTKPLTRIKTRENNNL